MSKTIQQTEDFFILLLSTSKFQARALLETATPPQVLAVREVIANILNPDLKLTPTTRELINKRRRILKSIVDKHSPALKIANHSRLVLDTLLAVRSLILSQL